MEVGATQPVEGLTAHEQAMIDLVDTKASEIAAIADPENAPEYVEETPTEEIDYKAEYEKLVNKPEEVKETSKENLDIKETPKEEPDSTEGNPGELTNAQMDKFGAEFDSTGTLSEASYAELAKKGITKGVVDSYIQGQNAIKEANTNKAFERAGGAEEYSEMVAWAKETWSKEQISVFNSQVLSGNQAQVMFGVDSLKSQYAAQKGSPMPSRTLKGNSGGGGNPGTKGYADRGEMYKAMRNPLYGKDASYTQTVARKVEQSTF